jgi:hypothetical protein
LFYKDSLKHGTHPDKLSPVIEGLSTVCFVRAPGVESNRGLSFVNEGEAEAIVEIVKALVDKGVQPSEIGIIALCKYFLVEMARRMIMEF